MDFQFRPSKKVSFFAQSFFWKWPKFAKILMLSVLQFFKSQDFACNHFFLSIYNPGGSGKSHKIGLKRILKSVLFQLWCPFFVTKTLKCNVIILSKMSKHSRNDKSLIYLDNIIVSVNGYDWPYLDGMVMILMVL